MKLIATIPVRNEAWVLGLSARVALMWCDEVVFLNHASTDATVDILAEIQREAPFRVSIISTPAQQWDEMQHRQFMLDHARQRGATHIAIVDADEVLTGNLLGTIREYVALDVGGVLQLPGYNLRGSVCNYHNSGLWGNRWFSVAFRDQPQLHWNGDRFHHREPMGLPLFPYSPVSQGRGGVMHLWGASERRLRAKSAHYKMVERLRWPAKPVPEIDAMYSWAIHGPAHDRRAQWTFAQTPESWWAPYSHLMKYLDLDADPWQEADCQRMWTENPGAFAGLDLFGICG